MKEDIPEFQVGGQVSSAVPVAVATATKTVGEGSTTSTRAESNLALSDRLAEVEKRAGELEERVEILKRENITVTSKKESLIVWEELMRLLESLDGLYLGEECELKSQRSRLSARINKILDTIDGNQNMDEDGSESESDPVLPHQSIPKRVGIVQVK
jgi:hypothetical protein